MIPRTKKDPMPPPAKETGTGPTTEIPKDPDARILRFGPNAADRLACEGVGPRGHRLLCLDCGASLEINCNGQDEGGDTGVEATYVIGADVLRGVERVAADLEVSIYVAVRLLLAAGLQAVGRGVNAWDPRPNQLRRHLAGGCPSAEEATS